MKISGATFVRNGVKLGYPFIESIKSILPVCDEVVVAVGDSVDGTREKIERIGSPKIRVIDTVWNESKRSGGEILSEQTNTALSKCTGDWIFYIQADEVLHEDDAPKIIPAVELAGGGRAVDGLAFEYLHFYGGYFTLQAGRHWYSQEVRLIRNNSGIVSYGDAQGFRKNGNKIRAAACGARIFHYGWARPPEVMVEKIKSFHRLWHNDEWIQNYCASGDAKTYFTDLGNLKDFNGTHPAVMKDIINTETEAFINGCKAQYMKGRPFFAAVRDFIRSLPLGRHRNFKLIRKYNG